MIPLATNTEEFKAYLKNYHSKDMVKITCPKCEGVFERTKSYIQSHFGPAHNQKFISCSKECYKKMITKKIPLNCSYCSKPILKTPSEIRDTKNGRSFCNSSCAGSYNGHAFIKRKKQPRIKIEKTNPITHRKVIVYAKYVCSSCGKNQVRNNGAKCKSCLALHFITSFGERQIKDFNSTYARHRYQKIRHHAHRVARFYNLEKKCAICGYEFWTDLCHIKSIGEFDPETKVSEVNDIKNLAFLCSNHHKELDKGFLKWSERGDSNP